MEVKLAADELIIARTDREKAPGELEAIQKNFDQAKLNYQLALWRNLAAEQNLRAVKKEHEAKYEPTPDGFAAFKKSVEEVKIPENV